jgi:hypothetical protein
MTEVLIAETSIAVITKAFSCTTEWGCCFVFAKKHSLNTS